VEHPWGATAAVQGYSDTKQFRWRVPVGPGVRSQPNGSLEAALAIDTFSPSLATKQMAPAKVRQGPRFDQMLFSTRSAEPSTLEVWWAYLHTKSEPALMYSGRLSYLTTPTDDTKGHIAGYDPIGLYAPQNLHLVALGPTVGIFQGLTFIKCPRTMYQPNCTELDVPIAPNDTCR